jgi:hypothetical protein
MADGSITSCAICLQTHHATGHHVRTTLLRKAVAVLKHNARSAEHNKSATIAQLSSTTGVNRHETEANNISSGRYTSSNINTNDYFGRTSVSTATASTATSSMNTGRTSVSKGSSYLAKHLLKLNIGAAQQ